MKEMMWREKTEELKNLYESMLNTSANDHKKREEIAGELLSRQQEDGSWKVIDRMQGDFDIIVAYAYFPSYYATAALIYKENMDGRFNDDERAALSAGLEFASKKNLVGHGYTATAQRLKALGVYKRAGMYEWIRNYGKDYSEFVTVIKRIITGFRVGLATGRTYSDWNRNFEEEFRQEVEEFDHKAGQEVWYAAYGSNIYKDRFMKYIERCSIKEAPAESRSWTLPGKLYFAGKSSLWGRRGTAFIDFDSDEATDDSFVLGRLYRIHMDQFFEIQKMEGPNYTKKVFLFMLEGIPVYTFTSEKVENLRSPSLDYVETILGGLKETFPDRSELALEVYLYRRGVLSEMDHEILSYIRESEHAVTLEELASMPGYPLGITKARNSIRTLINLHLIKQDRRSAERGDKVSDSDALFYSCKEKRDLVDILTLS